jgi:hypothetical protein
MEQLEMDLKPGRELESTPALAELAEAMKSRMPRRRGLLRSLAEAQERPDFARGSRLSSTPQGRERQQADLAGSSRDSRRRRSMSPESLAEMARPFKTPRTSSSR